MTRTGMKVFAFATLLSIAGAVLADNAEDEALKEIASYRKWTRVNDKPITVTSSTGAA